MNETTRAAFYDRYWKDELVTDSPHQRWKIRVLREVIAGLRGNSILDVGAGDGAMLSGVAPRSWKRVGTDVADDALAKLEARGITAAKVDLESGRLPFDDGAFDVTMCLDVLEHVFATEELARELARVTSPDGHVLIAVPNGFNLANRLAFALGRHVDVMDVAHRTGGRFSEHIRFFSEPVLDQLLDDAGLAPIERHYYFPDELTDSRFQVGRWAGRLITVPRLHERIPSLFSLAFLVVCRRKRG